MGLAGSIYFDDAFCPLRDKSYRLVEAGRTVIPMQAHGVPGASNDKRRGVNTASSSSPNQSLVSSTRILGSRDGDALQVRGGTIRETNRDVTVEAPDGPKASSSAASSGRKPSLSAAPPTQSASENSTFVQQHKALIRPRAEDLQPRAKLTPIPENEADDY